MRVVLVTHYFPPEVGAPQARLSEMAATWAEDGHEVTVLTGMPNHPTGVIDPAYRRAIRRVEHSDGYRVVRTWLYATPNEGIVKKTLGHLSFMITAVVLGFTKVGRPDVVVVSSPTFFSIGSAWLLARAKRARFVVEIRDLWPAIFVELGVLTNRHTIRALERLELAAYRSADEVVAVTNGFRDNIVRRGTPGSKVHVIPNGVDLDRFTPQIADPEVRRRLGAGPGDVLVLYAGAHGISHGLTAVADAAARLVGEPIVFAFVGEGAHKKALQARVDELKLPNVTLHPAVRRHEMLSLIGAADICLVPLRNVPLFDTFIPSKMFEFMAMQRPVIGSVSGEAAGILRDAVQLVVEPENPDQLAGAIAELAVDPERRHQLAQHGREFVRDRYSRAALARIYETVLEGPPCA
jgi:hypothetical protein